VTNRLGASRIGAAHSFLAGHKASSMGGKARYG
jgi:hypothetical protein